MKLYSAIMYVKAQGFYQPVIKFISEDKTKVEEYANKWNENNKFHHKLTIEEIETDKELLLTSQIIW